MRNLPQTVQNGMVKKRKELFLIELQNTGIPSKAAKLADMDLSTFYRHRKSDLDFGQKWEQALVIATENMEIEAHRRAVEGVLEPVYYRGEKVGEIRKHSDILLIFLLKANNPDKFREKIDINKKTEVNHRHTLDVSKLNDDELSTLETLLSKAKPPELPAPIDITPTEVVQDASEGVIYDN